MIFILRTFQENLLIQSQSILPLLLRFCFETGSFHISYLYVAPPSAQKLYSLEPFRHWSDLGGHRGVVLVPGGQERAVPYFLAALPVSTAKTRTEHTGVSVYALCL